MSVDACASLLRQGDPDRFLATMTAPPGDRAALLVLYAFNLELARIPWVTNEPVIAEMRLQFWADVIEAIQQGRPARAHEVAGPLAVLLAEKSLPVSLFSEMIAARQFDIYKEPHMSDAALAMYLDHTAGHLMWLGCLALGADHNLQIPVRNAALGAGTAAYLRAVPALTASGRQPLVDASDAGIARLAQTGLDGLHLARKTEFPARILPVLRAGWLAKPILTSACKTPQAVTENRLYPSEFYRRSLLLAKTLTGRW